MALFSELNQRGRHHYRLITHEPDIATYANRLVRLSDGRIVYDGPVEHAAPEHLRRHHDQPHAQRSLGWRCWANRLRTILTMLGMVIGVGAVILMLAVGQGAQQQVQASIASMGSNLFIILSGSTTSGGAAWAAAPRRR